ncbi:acyl-CoA dehydrogenase C-terminal domain-containing protein [Shewanella glacialipiscicola]|uniref:acyl-CoA dehydrogenase family protein n=1 Tax=Shewanella glacialipiscicola TaxID=614069 RepID=UPI0021D8AF92|nr:acyl-CoA dehydrogenase family protein [Shewanella glacialipiscicola]MCU7993341.1 acyl-CoA dehydrogenase C-terminal domain-containing protein [Shewanella glacialipiscicola]MCU8024658.1 acyl-CoA dehydrogenase C-terminal domain-containing protein [Shewanella glacialipiscicola]
MNPYQAPLTDMRFLLEQVFDAPTTWAQLPDIAEIVDIDTANAILEEAAKISSDLIHPLNRTGDEQGVLHQDNQVITPGGYKAVYEQYSQGGWIGLCGDAEFGGMGMPKMLGILVDEMAYSACNAFTLYGSLTAGAALCINAHGSEELKQAYLPKLYSGEWAGAMDMTEPQAGSDLRSIRTRALPQDDGSYAITGSKIFITGGDHDLTENVIHLVLAKLPDSKGISLFLVPKISINADGSLANPNGVSVGSIEHKMGLKGSATCVMNYDNAQGYLIGEPNRGLVCMFTMMNYERLAIGIQGLGSAQAAYQMAADYAKERNQGVAAGGSPTGSESDPIIVHGDVRRMLLTIRAMTEAGRALSVFTGQQLDLAKYAQDDVKAKAARYVGLLTPVAKAFLTDRGLDATIMAQQVFGGHGYIRETGIEQLVRDTRIAQIYEGTNGIQAIDFLGRKVTGDNLAALNEFVADLKAQMRSFTHVDAVKVAAVSSRLDALVVVAESVNQHKVAQPALINACAVDFLDAFGYTLYGFYWLAMVDKVTDHEDKVFAEQKNYLAKFYFDKLLPKADYHIAQVRAGDTTTMAMPAELF